MIMDHLIPARRPDLILINKKERTCQLVDFAGPADHRVKLKENLKNGQISGPCQKTEKVMEYESESDTNCVVGALGTVPKGLERGFENMEIRGRIDTIQNTALLQSARILSRVLET